MRTSKIVLNGWCLFVAGLLAVRVSAETVLSGPESQTYKGIPYLSGGIGVDERETLRQQAKDYNLMLGFAEKAGNYLSDVEVVIKNAKGDTVLEAVSQGPWFFTKLPAGTYTVIATMTGKTQRHVVKVAATGHAQLYFYW